MYIYLYIAYTYLLPTNTFTMISKVSRGRRLVLDLYVYASSLDVLMIIINIRKIEHISN